MPAPNTSYRLVHRKFLPLLVFCLPVTQTKFQLLVQMLTFELELDSLEFTQKGDPEDRLSKFYKFPKVKLITRTHIS